MTTTSIPKKEVAKPKSRGWVNPKGDIKEELTTIVLDVAEISGVHPGLIYGRRRYERGCTARFLVYFLLYQRGWSLNSVGDAFPETRDHGTVLHGVKAVCDGHHYRKGMDDLIEKLEQRGYKIWLREGIRNG